MGIIKKPAGKKKIKDEDFRDNYQSASGIYITLMLEKIFPGLKKACMKDEEQGGISLEDLKKGATAYEWFDKYLMDHVNSKKKEFQMIIRGLYRAMKAGESGEVKYENLRERAADMLNRILIERNFPFPSPDDKISLARINFGSYCFNLGKNKQSKFSGVLNSIIAACLKEGRSKPQDKMVFD